MKSIWLIACLSLPACGAELPPIASVDLLQTVTQSADRVAPGQAFDLTVVRVWEKSMEAGPWDDKALSPLVLTNEQVSRREDKLRIEETRVFRAFAFSRKDVSVAAAPFVTKTRDGELRWVESDPLRVRVQPVVEAQNPGPPELPGVSLLLPPSRGMWVLGMFALAVMAALFFGLQVVHRRRSARGDTAPAPTAPADPLTLLTSAEPDYAVMAAADAIRLRIAARTPIPAPLRTSVEVLQGEVADTLRTPLGALLFRADSIKYGQVAATAADAQAAIADARACLAALAQDPV